MSVWGRAAGKEDASSRVRFGRDPLSSPMSRVRESQPQEAVALNPSQKQVREQKGNNAEDLKKVGFLKNEHPSQPAPH